MPTAQVKASMKWNEKNIKQFKINLNKQEDQDIINVLAGVENKQGFIKELIRDWIADHEAS